MNEDLIRRSDVLNLATCITKPTYDSPYCESVVYVEDIEAIPSIDAGLTQHGEWIPIEMEMRFGTLHGVKCSLCGEKKVREGSNYCPNCGAKMDKGVQNDQN